MKISFLIVFPLFLAGCAGMYIPTSPPAATSPTPAALSPSKPALSPSRVLDQLPGSLAPTPAGCAVRTGVQGGRLHLRACPGMRCAVLDILEEGDQVVITQPGGEWSKVRAGELTGWAASRYLECAK